MGEIWTCRPGEPGYLRLCLRETVQHHAMMECFQTLLQDRLITTKSLQTLNNCINKKGPEAT